MNDTLGPEGIVSSALIFSAFFQLSSISEARSSRSNLIKRADDANTARKKMGKIMSRMKLNRALQNAVLPACDRSFQPGDNDLL